MRASPGPGLGPSDARVTLQKKASVKRQMLPIRNQGHISSCQHGVGQATLPFVKIKEWFHFFVLVIPESAYINKLISIIHSYVYHLSLLFLETKEYSQ